MSRPVGRHRARRDTGIRALRRPAVAATAAISSVSVGAAAYATAATANASVSGVARANIALGASTAAFNAANSGVAADAQAQTAAADRAVTARTTADAKARAAAAARATAATKLQGKAAASAKAAQAAAAKKAAAAKRAAAPDTSRSTSRPPATYSGNPQSIASAMLPSYGWDQGQMGCLVSLWNRESGWRVGATNPSSGAYGIPQSLPGYKMASAGADWRTNPATQIRWGLGYIKSTYGSPCGAWGHSQATGWY